MASRKDDKDRLRAERLAAEQEEAAKQRRRAMLGYGGAGILAAIVLAGIVVVATSGGGGSSSPSGGCANAANAHIDLTTGSQNGVPCDDRAGTTPPALAQAAPAILSRWHCVPSQ